MIKFTFLIRPDKASCFRIDPDRIAAGLFEMMSSVCQHMSRCSSGPAIQDGLAKIQVLAAAHGMRVKHWTDPKAKELRIEVTTKGGACGSQTTD